MVIFPPATENAYVAMQSLHGDSGACCRIPRFLHQTGCGNDFISTEEHAWSKQPSGTSKTSGCKKLTARHAVTDSIGHRNLPSASVASNVCDASADRLQSAEDVLKLTLR